MSDKILLVSSLALMFGLGMAFERDRTKPQPPLPITVGDNPRLTITEGPLIMGVNPIGDAGVISLDSNGFVRARCYAHGQ